jgi:hypothetical protein
MIAICKGEEMKPAAISSGLGNFIYPLLDREPQCKSRRTLDISPTSSISTTAQRRIQKQ